jgi:hypothetical protein
MYDDYEIPDGISPLIGYRGWTVSGDTLQSCFREVEWPVGSPLQSECIRPTFREDSGILPAPPKHYWSPHLGCTCGIYALHEYPQAWQEFDDGRKKTPKPWPSEAVTGIIQGWGRIIVGDKGFRAQYAKPVALVSRRRNKRWPETIERLAECYGLEIVSARSVRRNQP